MKNKMKKIKVTRKLLNILRSYTKLFGGIETDYYRRIVELEKMMEHETGIKGIEFFFCDGEFAGIGNAERTMKLIHRHDLEK